MTAKVIVGKLHRWLGLGSGLIVFIVSITGCLYAFEEELFNLFHRKAVYVEVPEKPVLKPLSELMEIARKASPAGRSMEQVLIKDDPEKAYMFVSFKFDKEKAEKSIWVSGGYEYYDRMFVNPYTGEVTGTVNMLYDFFLVSRQIHQSLYLRHEIGGMIVGTSILIFLLMLISGLILWWPRNKAAAKQRFSFKWKKTTSFKRKNYDLHNILGFYILTIGIFFAITGLVWSFTWWENGVYKLLGSERKTGVPAKPATVNANPLSSTAAIDIAYNDVRSKREHFKRIFVLPNEAKRTVQCLLQYEGGTIWEESDNFYYDLDTGTEYARELQEQKTLGTKWRVSNYGLHTGKILDLPGAILAFIGSLICASLPVTGFYIWWGRRRKSSKARRSISLAAQAA